MQCMPDELPKVKGRKDCVCYKNTLDNYEATVAEGTRELS